MQGVHLAGGLGTVRVWVSEHILVNRRGAEVAGGRSARGQPFTHPAVQLAAAEGIIPLPGALHHHAVLALAPVVGFARPPVAGAEGFGSENGGGGRSPTAFSLDTSLRVWALPTPSLQPRSTLSPHPLTSIWVCLPPKPAIAERHPLSESGPRGPSPPHSPSSPIVQGVLVHPDKLPLSVQVPKANPGALPVGTFGQEVLGSRTGLEGLGSCARVPPTVQEIEVGIHTPLPTKPRPTCSSSLWMLTSRPCSLLQANRAWIHFLGSLPK